MANSEHLRLVLSPDWNEWRGRNTGVTPDLTNADLSGKDISGKDLRRADMTRVNLSGATMAGTDFSRAILTMSRFEGASGPGAIFEYCDLDFLDLTGTFLAGARMRSASRNSARSKAPAGTTSK